MKYDYKNLSEALTAFNHYNGAIILKDISIQDVDLIEKNYQMANGTIVGAKVIKFVNCNINKVYITKSHNDIEFKKCKVTDFIVINSIIKSALTVFDSSVNSVEIDQSEFNNVKFLLSGFTNSLSANNSTFDTFHIATDNMNQCSLESIESNVMKITSSYYGNNKVNISNVKELMLNGKNKINKFQISHTKLNDEFIINNLLVTEFEEINELVISDISINDGKIKNIFPYSKPAVNCSNLNIKNKLFINNIDLSKSTFRKLNLSKIIFSNCLISHAEFYELDVIRANDYKLSSLTLPVSILSIIAMILSMYYLVFPIIPLAYLIAYFGFILLKSNHVSTKDEYSYSDKEQSKDFYKKISNNSLHDLKELESIYMQLKQSFNKTGNRHMFHEFLYAESLMKIKQKTIWKNIFNIDFYSYLLNGFGRRWLRAFITFIFSIVVFTVSVSYVENYTIDKSKSPDFVNKYYTEAIDTFGQHYEKTNINNTIEEVQVKLNILYVLSSMDILKLKTHNWFNDKTYSSFYYRNFMGISLLIIFSSFLLAFKRRIER